MNNLNINAALRFIYDTMESALITDYVVLGEAGRAIYEQRQVDGQEIEIGIRSNQFTPEVVSLFKQWGFTKTDRGWDTSFENIQIHFRVIKRHYKFLEKPDVRFYDVDEYHIPNPFEDYWKIKQIVR